MTFAYSMNPEGIKAFPHYYVGIDSLAELATRQDRVCVLNILGGESRTVTPTSHVYSGGNIVCGTMPGRRGAALKTELGDIPVYNNEVEALDAGHRFNVAVVYVPPAGVRHSVIEAVRVNPDLNKLVILTEKVPVADAAIIRQYCQRQGVDVFGANCLGIADAHQHVRIGGALGGNSPEESLVPGSVAIYSNSGNFTTTIATYLLTEGWGTTVSFSSGKDVYIHFAALEFAHAFHNDERSKAAVMYIEPGGYYEHDLELRKPVVACVVGRWKANLTRACGHAGAIAGMGDGATEKEKWFMGKLEVDGIYTPGSDLYSAKGAVVTNIAHVPSAMTAVMAANNIAPDFEPIGNLSMKCWFANDQGIELPAELAPPVVAALEPYSEQIALLDDQVGAVFPRQSMKDASGASAMDRTSQVSRLHGVSVLDAATRSFEENLVQSLIHEYPDENDRALANVALNAYVNQYGTPYLAAADAAREGGSSPNSVFAAALAILGPKHVADSRAATRALLELFRSSGLRDAADPLFDCGAQVEAALTGPIRDVLITDRDVERGRAMLAAIRSRGAVSVFTRFLERIAEQSGGAMGAQVVLAAICCHLAWAGLLRKRLSLTTLFALPWHLRIFSTLVGTTVPSTLQTEATFRGVSNVELMENWSFAETAHLALLGGRPDETALFSLSVLLGLTITNGPGTISSQGAKGAVSADGSEDPERVQINKGYLGFLTHTGFAHGGNGFEAMAFLIEQFRSTDLSDPSRADHGLDLAAMAADFAREYKAYKTRVKAEGALSYSKIPCVNHPVFKGKDVNFDPREVFVRKLLEKRGVYNVFLGFYHELVEALCKYGVSSNVYCVNIDAVIAVILLEMYWKEFVAGKSAMADLETAAFTTFLYGRMIGTAAEIDDHTQRGLNMDTRTPVSQCRHVS